MQVLWLLIVVGVLLLQPGDIAEVKAMKNPPAGVKLVMASVCVMKGINPERIPDPAGTGNKVTGCFCFSTVNTQQFQSKLQF